MARWRKNESMGKAIAREGGGIAKSVGKELLSIATLGFYSPRPKVSQVTIKYANGKVVRIRK